MNPTTPAIASDEGEGAFCPLPPIRGFSCKQAITSSCFTQGEDQCRKESQSWSLTWLVHCTKILPRLSHSTHGMASPLHPPYLIAPFPVFWCVKDKGGVSSVLVVGFTKLLSTKRGGGILAETPDFTTLSIHKAHGWDGMPVLRMQAVGNHVCGLSIHG